MPEERRDERGVDPAEPDGSQGELDLLSAGLVVFFVALIGIVGILLVLPALS